VSIARAVKKKLDEYLDGRAYCYIMHLNYNTRTDEDRRMHWTYGKDHRLIGLDRFDVNTDWNCKSDIEKAKFRSQFPQWYSQFEMFCNEMTRNDLIIAMAGYDLFLGFGTVNQDGYNYDPKLKVDRTFFDHTRQMDWVMALDYDRRIRLSEPLKGFNRTLLKIDPNHKYWKILANVEV